MARARNIKPGFYKNEELAECSVWARFVFPGLWMLADREGRLEDRPKRIKAEVLPFDTQDVEPLLVELHNRGFIYRYAIEGVRYIQIIAFKRHQTPHYTEKKSEIKAPELPEFAANMCGTDSKSLRTSNAGKDQEKPKTKPPIKRWSLPPDSLNPDSLNHESRKPKGAAAPRFELPDWVPPDDWTAFDEHRKKAKKPMTDRAKQLVVMQLDKLRTAGHAPNLVLQQSIRRGWLDVFPLKGDQPPAAVPIGAWPRANAL